MKRKTSGGALAEADVRAVGANVSRPGAEALIAESAAPNGLRKGGGAVQLRFCYQLAPGLTA